MSSEAPSAGVAAEPAAQAEEVQQEPEDSETVSRAEFDRLVTWMDEQNARAECAEEELRKVRGEIKELYRQNELLVMMHYTPWLGYACNGCGKEFPAVVEDRYHCMSCEDLDFCVDCVLGHQSQPPGDGHAVLCITNQTNPGVPEKAKKHYPANARARMVQEAAIAQMKKMRADASPVRTPTAPEPDVGQQYEAPQSRVIRPYQPGRFGQGVPTAARAPIRGNQRFNRPAGLSAPGTGVAGVPLVHVPDPYNLRYGSHGSPAGSFSNVGYRSSMNSMDHSTSLAAPVWTPAFSTSANSNPYSANAGAMDDSNTDPFAQARQTRS